MFTGTVDLADFDRQVERTLDTIVTTLGDAIRIAAHEGAAEAKAVGQFKDRTRRLRGSIVAKFVSSNALGVQWQILSPAKYSKFVESPTKPHQIVARNAPMLVFQLDGRKVVTRSVNHPGTHGTPFMGPAMQKAERVLHRELATTLMGRVQRLWP
jgi:hypothetical protein